MEKGNTYIRFDWAIKHTLRDKANFGILEGFLTVLLGQEIKIVEILESESNQEREDDKFNRVDIKAKNDRGHLIIVEVQLTSQFYYLQRILYGACKTITDHIRLGDKYDKVKKVYSISILYCDFGEGDDYIYKGETEFRGLNTRDTLVIRTREDGVIVPHLPSEIFPEYYILRVNSYDKVAQNYLDEWMTYLKTGTVRDDTRAPGLQEVKEKLRLMSMSRKERASYEIHVDNLMQQNDMYDTARTEGFAQGHAEGRTEGRAEGRAEGIHKVAANMLAMGIDESTILKLTGLAQDELERLAKGME